MQIRCGACDGVLRHESGVHRDGEPPVYRSEGRRYVVCPKCSAKNKWDPERPVRSDEVDVRIDR